MGLEFIGYIITIYLMEVNFMKVFLSHPMHNLTCERVHEIRQKAIDELISVYGDNIEIIDNYNHKDVPENAGRLWHLGTSIRMMEDADLVYFCDNWKHSNGCIVEHLICEQYRIPFRDTPFVE